MYCSSMREKDFRNTDAQLSWRIFPAQNEPLAKSIITLGYHPPLGVTAPNAVVGATVLKLSRTKLGNPQERS
jgi:hypothetical protein